ncbi:amino acid adenylation domain-containing protein [Bacillus subtilis]
MKLVEKLNEKQEVKVYWNKYLEGFDAKSILPYNNYNILGQNIKEYSTYYVDTKLNYKSFNKEKSILLYAAWALLLQKYNNFEEIVFGISTNEKFLPIRVKYEPNQTVNQFIQSLEGNINQCKLHSEVTIEEITIVEKVFQNQLLFDSIVVGQSTDLPPVSFSLEFTNNVNMEFNIKYDKSMFEFATVERIGMHLTNILTELLNSPEIFTKDIEIMSEEETNQVLNEFNNLVIDYDQSLTVDKWFEEQVEKSPEKVAIICGARSITYKQLNEKANQLARYLKKQGVTSEELVGLIVERDIELIIGMLGVIKAGGAYLPVDPAFPQERINYMFRNGSVNILLTEKESNIKLDYDCKSIFLDDKKIINGDSSNIENNHSPENLMYVLYTSGSTGLPKGVAVEHRNVVGYVNAFLNEFAVSENDKMLQQSTVSFDISVEEIYPILLTGGTLVIAKREEVEDIPSLLEVMEKNEVTMLSGFPLLLNELNKYPIVESVHTMISGGDVLREEYVTNLVDKVNVYNTYGPSETTVCINYYKYKGECNKGSIPTGKTIGNYKVYILDKNLNPMPIGIPGEVCISGIGVSRGYYNRPDITEERYIDNPFNPEEKMFVSSDRAKWLPNGNIEFLGRIDDQIKVRGRRTEPGEVQQVLIKHETVKEAFVLGRRDKYNHIYLTAYVTGEEILSAADLKAFLGKHLPDFMVPNYFVQLDQLPLTPNGKINKAELPLIID